MSILDNTTTIEELIEIADNLPDQIDTSNAENTLKNFLTDNGVTVPEGTLLDGLVALLGDVEVGGGSENSIILEHGEIVVAESSNDAIPIPIEHLDKRRTIFIYLEKNSDEEIPKASIAFSISSYTAVSINTRYTIGRYGSGSYATNNVNDNQSVGFRWAVDLSSLSFLSKANTLYNYGLVAGYTYKWYLLND